MMRGMAEEASFEGPLQIGEARNTGPGREALASALHARHARYPGCQQLQLWLPRPGHLADGQLRIVHAGGQVLAEGRLRDHLNGSVQMLFDTLAWPPGRIEVRIDCDDGIGHRLHLDKLTGDPPPAPPLPPPPVVDHPPIVYRDGFGRLIENEDLRLRVQVQAQIAQVFSRRLAYSGTYRAGTIHYIEPGLQIDFPHEMCGGELQFSIDVPAEADWERATGAPLARREDIVAFVAERVRSEKAASWNYRITPRSIDFR